MPRKRRARQVRIEVIGVLTDDVDTSGDGRRAPHTHHVSSLKGPENLLIRW